MTRTAPTAGHPPSAPCRLGAKRARAVWLRGLNPCFGGKGGGQARSQGALVHTAAVDAAATARHGPAGLVPWHGVVYGRTTGASVAGCGPHMPAAPNSPCAYAPRRQDGVEDVLRLRCHLLLDRGQRPLNIAQEAQACAGQVAAPGVCAGCNAGRVVVQHHDQRAGGTDRHATLLGAPCARPCPWRRP